MAVMNNFALKSKSGYYVHRFSAANQCVVLTRDVCIAKRFATEQAATAWLHAHSGRGYGLGAGWAAVNLDFNPGDVTFA